MSMSGWTTNSSCIRWAHTPSTDVKESEGLTMAGLMMFGKGIAIREVCPQFRSDYLDRQGIEPGSSEKWNDRLTDDGTWEHNMYNFVTLVLRRLLLTLPNPGRLTGGERKDGYEVQDAVMEGLVNSIIHCDFAANGVLRIERRTDSIIMRNPGNLRISRKRYMKETSRTPETRLCSECCVWLAMETT